jgi:hypothetical protein
MDSTGKINGRPSFNDQINILIILKKYIDKLICYNSNKLFINTFVHRRWTLDGKRN